MDKKAVQLGMNPSTASNRLVKDILFSLIVETKRDYCHVCGDKILRNDFSIEHKIPWLDSEDPQKLFFDLDNIAFSHLKCNIASSRKTLAPCGTVSAYQRGCRCRPCMDASMFKARQAYSSEKRKARYIKNEMPTM